MSVIRVDRQRVADLLAAGVQQNLIAAEVGCTPKTICFIKRELEGTKPGPVGRQPSIDRDEAMRLFKSGASNLEVAAALGLRPNTIPRLKRDLGIEVKGFRKGIGRRVTGVAQGGSGPGVANRIATSQRHAENRARSDPAPKGQRLENAGGIRISMLSRATDAGRPRDRMELPLLVIPRHRHAPLVENLGAVQFRHLVAGQCKWIAGDTVKHRADEALACAAPVVGIGCPYCPGHAAAAHGIGTVSERAAAPVPAAQEAA